VWFEFLTVLKGFETMRTHNVKSAAELKLLRMSKDEAFKSMGETFDYAMPQIG